MILTLEDLPSKGKFGHAPAISLRPLTFREMIDYSNEVTGNPLKSYLRDIKWLRFLDSNILQHSLYDLDYLVFMMKVHTISDNKEFQSEIKCRQCGHEERIDFDLGDFKFKDIEEEGKQVKRVVLNGFKYVIKVPTIGDFLEVLNKYVLYNKVSQADVVKLISLFSEFPTIPNDVERDVLNATRDEIAVLYLLEDKYLTSVKPIIKKCNKCENERGMAVGVTSLIADMFRDVLFNNTAIESKIQFE